MSSGTNHDIIRGNMAIITTPSVPADLAGIVATTIRYKRTSSGLRAERWTPNPRRLTPAYLAHLTRWQNAKIAWAVLRKWKRERWIICANKTGKRGESLYIREYLSQATIYPSQPVSPCSRRMTDPLADPWDYTP